MRTRQDVGRLGEQIATEYLETLGWRILDRNWFGPGGELDIVALDVAEDAVVGVEVKTRRDAAYGSPAEAVTRTKVARLRKLLACWLASHDVHSDGVRLDLVAIRLGAPARVVDLDHLTGIV